MIGDGLVNPKIYIKSKMIKALSSVFLQLVSDKGWAVAILSTYSPGDDIFKRDYLSQPIKNIKTPLNIIKVPHGFLEHLPPKKQSKRRIKARMKILKDAKHEI